MADSMVIKEHLFKKNTRCAVCRKEFSGSGYEEKCIAGYTPEGYLFTMRSYCPECGSARKEKLIASGMQDKYQFPEE